jgi:hypothetical protein
MPPDDDSPKKPRESVSELAQRVRVTDELRTARILDATNPLKRAIQAVQPKNALLEFLAPSRELQASFRPARTSQRALRLEWSEVDPTFRTTKWDG